MADLLSNPLAIVGLIVVLIIVVAVVAMMALRGRGRSSDSGMATPVADRLRTRDDR